MKVYDKFFYLSEEYSVEGTLYLVNGDLVIECKNGFLKLVFMHILDLIWFHPWYWHYQSGPNDQFIIFVEHFMDIKQCIFKDLNNLSWNI